MTAVFRDRPVLLGDRGTGYWVTCSPVHATEYARCQCERIRVRRPVPGSCGPRLPRNPAARATQTKKMSHFRLATWNLRYDVQPDSIPVAKSLAALPDLRVAPPPVPPGERPWSARRIHVAQRLAASHVDLVGAFQNRGEFFHYKVMTI